MTHPKLTAHQEDITRDAIGLLRAAARGDTVATGICAAHLTNAPVTAALLATWLVDLSKSTGVEDVPAAVEEFAAGMGLG